MNNYPIFRCQKSKHKCSFKVFSIFKLKLKLLEKEILILFLIIYLRYQQNSTTTTNNINN